MRKYRQAASRRGPATKEEGRAASTDETLKIYDEAYHEVFNDYPRDEFVHDTLDWLERYC